MNTPNKLTLIRVILIPFFVAFLMLEGTFSGIMALLIFVVASATDWLDGYLARKNNEVTTFGKLMDPLADKILTLSAFICFIELSYFPAWAVILIISRELIITGIRQLALTNDKVIAASWWGKSKTILQMVTIILFLLIRVLPSSFAYSAFILIFEEILVYLNVILTLVSGIDYVAKSWDLLTFK